MAGHPVTTEDQNADLPLAETGHNYRLQDQSIDPDELAKSVSHHPAPMSPIHKVFGRSCRAKDSGSTCGCDSLLDRDAERRDNRCCTGDFRGAAGYSVDGRVDQCQLGGQEPRR